MNTDSYNIVKDFLIGLSGGSLPEEGRASTDPLGDATRIFHSESASFLNGMNFPGLPHFTVA